MYECGLSVAGITGDDNEFVFQRLNVGNEFLVELGLGICQGVKRRFIESGARAAVAMA